MESKKLTFGQDSRIGIGRGITNLAKAVKVTLGPRGRNVVIQQRGKQPHSTKDGVTVAKSITFKDAEENVGAQIVKQVSSKTADVAGDGPQPLYAKVLTPTGYKSMGDISVGDAVCGTDSSTQIVLGVYPKGEREICEVIFSDGRKVECCEDHLFSVMTLNHGEEKVITVKEMFDSGREKANQEYFVPTSVAAFQKKDLPLDPYLVGTLIADDRLEGLGVKSDESSIPEDYLYGSISDRKQLLNGLLDAGGDRNHRGMFEYCTVNESLLKSFQSLCRGLGIQICSNVNMSGEDGSLVYKVSELSGHGLKIADIRKTGKYTEMQCIKVSNDDHLYFTNDYVLTHNTTTATVLAEDIFTQGMKLVGAGSDPMSLKRGIDKATVAVVASLDGLSRPVETVSDIHKVATISANGDVEIGDMIAEAMEKVGNNGVITLEEGKGVASKLRISEGFEFDRGFASLYFQTPSEIEAGRERCVFEDAKIWLIDGKLSSRNHFEQMQGTLELCVKEGKPIVIIAEAIEDVVLNTLALNAAQGSLPCVAIKAPGFGEVRGEILEDLAVLTGATLRNPAHHKNVLKDVTIEELGDVARIEVTKEGTIIIAPEGREEKVEAQCGKIRAKLKEIDGMWDRDQQEKRLAKLTGGVAVIEVGAPTEVAMKERRDRIEDALSATRAAVAEGIVPGGGTALVRAGVLAEASFAEENVEELAGAKIIFNAVREPMRQIAENAGEKSPDSVVEQVLNGGLTAGFDAAKREHCENMFERGIVDPAKVSRVALQNAADVAGLLLTTECVITIEEEEKPVVANQMMRR